MPQSPAVVSGPGLDGSSGFTITGFPSQNQYNYGVVRSVWSAGDVNHDGYGDLIIGVSGDATNGLNAGAAYVLFGHPGGFPSTFNLNSVDGTNGFKVLGVATEDLAGASVSSGDFNGDGYSDVMIDAPLHSGLTGYQSTVYVVYGRASGFSATLDLAALDGTNGFKLYQAHENTAGNSVATEDVNRDGLADIIVGAQLDGSGPSGYESGTTFVVFGRTSGMPVSFDMETVNGSTGFSVHGSRRDYSGRHVASAGDFNGDGFQDFLIGSHSGNYPGAGADKTYVVFGHGGSFSPALDASSLDGTNGFVLLAPFSSGDVGRSAASAGDVNDDGFDDLIIDTSSGTAYVVFGQATSSASFDLGNINGVNGFRVAAGASESVSGAGDVNGDGFADLIVGVPQYSSFTTAGAGYVIYGKASGFAPSINLTSLNGANGFQITSTAGYAGTAVAGTGDLNGDGLADVVMVAGNGTPGYVVFGALPNTSVVRTGTALGQTIMGGAFNDTLSGLGGDDRLVGNGGDDTLEGGTGDDTLDGGQGSDTASYASAGIGVTVSVALAGDQFTGGAGLDNLVSIENLIGSAYDDVLTGDGTANVLEGGAGNDTLDGGSGTDVASYAGAGSGVTVNLVSAGAQATLGAGTDALISIEGLIGSGFDDTLTAGATGSSLSGGGGGDILVGGAGNDTLDGGAGTDTASYAGAGSGVAVSLSLAGPQATLGAGTDTLISIEGLIGSGFDDTLGAGAGDNTLDGGAGTDTASFAGAGAGVTVSLAMAGAQATLGAGTDTLISIEALIGSGFADTLTAAVAGSFLSGGGGADTLLGGAGSDTLDGGSGADTASYAGAGSGVMVSLSQSGAQATIGGGTDTLISIEGLIGSGFDDALTAAATGSSLSGAGGNDTLVGGAGGDTLDGGSGTDTATFAGAGSGVSVNLSLAGPQATVGAGTDTLNSIEVLIGSGFDDTLTAAAAGSSLIGGGGDDTLFGGAGNDTLAGGSGIDTASYVGAGSGVTVSLALAGPQATLGAGADTLISIENLRGSSFNDLLAGDGGANLVSGGAGADTINGGAGADTLTGSAGDDHFVFALDAGADVVTDFTPGGTDDSLDLTAFAHIGSFEQVMSRAVQSGADTILKLGDEDSVTLRNVNRSALTAADFLLPTAVSSDLGSGADFNGDGLADVLWRDQSGIVALWLSQAGTSTVTYAGIDTVSSAWHIQGSGDFSGDGKADILWRRDDGFTALWQSTPSGQYSYVGLGQVGLNWHVQAVADFSGDGRADVLWRDDNGLTAEWRSNPNNSALTYAGVDQVNLNWHVQATADFNGDGLADILWRDDTGFVAEWLSVPGTSQVSYVGLNSAPLDWNILGAGDFNGDGRADILWRNDSGLVGLWQSGPGSTALTYAGLANVPLSWHVQAIGDFNNDGKADILWRDDTGRTALWDSTPGGAISYQDLGVIAASWFIS